MGKWTPDYRDDVLHAKISTLVSGAIHRAAVEKEPTISYESFVNELDTGDSFTTSLVDILVKELAERLTRPTPSDRRLIADRTAKSLRQLSMPIRVYHEQRPAGRTHGRRLVNLSDYLNPPPNEMEVEDEDELFEGVVDNVEGARINSEFYDAFGPHAWSSSIPTRRPISSSSPPPIDDDFSHRLPPPVTWPVSNTSSSSTVSLARQSSTRRAARSRVMDFNEFAHRRRSSLRDLNASRSQTPEVVTEPREASWSRVSQSARRFFPFSRSRRTEPTVNFPWNDVAETMSTETSDDSMQFVSIEPSLSNVTWLGANYPTPATSTSTSNSSEAEISGERARTTAPRLRRGGLRAPESMLSRHASPADIPAPEPTTPITPPIERANERHQSLEPAAYPTPGSSETENIS